MTDTSGLQVFLCHAKEDKTTVRALHDWLKSKGHRPWLDEFSIPPGRNWLLAIQEAIRESHVVLVCLSSNSVRKHGMVQREIKLVLDAATERPDDELYVIPCRLEACAVPNGIKHWQWVDLFESGGYERLERSLASCLAGLSPISIEKNEPNSRVDDSTEGENVGDAFEFVLHCAGTAARNTVNVILERYRARKDSTSHGDIIGWLVDSIEESLKNLSNVSAPEGDDFVSTRLKGAAMGAGLAANSFKKASSQIRDFLSNEQNINDQEEYILSRLQQVLDEWEDYDIDEWAARNS